MLLRRQAPVRSDCSKPFPVSFHKSLKSSLTIWQPVTKASSLSKHKLYLLDSTRELSGLRVGNASIPQADGFEKPGSEAFFALARLFGRLEAILQLSLRGRGG
jgi:hypothetical protein